LKKFIENNCEYETVVLEFEDLPLCKESKGKKKLIFDVSNMNRIDLYYGVNKLLYKFNSFNNLDSGSETEGYLITDDKPYIKIKIIK